MRAFANHESYRLYLEAEYPNARERVEDLDQLAVFAEQYRDLGAFLDAMTLAGDFAGRIDDAESGAREESDRNKLILSTIHQAKGLEWDAVFVLHCAQGTFPSDRSMGQSREIEEERRLFYVAATRARSKLYFTYPMTTGYESVELRQQSMFLDEIPFGMAETVRLRRAMPAWSMSSSYSTPTSSRHRAHDEFEEPTIVLDDMGEKMVKKSAPGSFLGDH